jgi:citrate synthase
MSSSSDEWQTSIAEVGHDDVVIRGYALSELVGRVTFTDAVFLDHTAELPTDEQRKMLDAIFVALIEHGISPSTIITRTLVSCGTPSQAAIAGGVLSIADWHGGSGEQLGEALSEVVESCSDVSGAELESALRASAASLVAQYRQEGKRFEGFGHPQHPDGDPRGKLLFAIADELGVAGTHVRLIRLLDDEIEQALGRRLAVNVTGAIAALLLDLGFSWRAIRGMVIAPRTAGLVAHVVEELEQQGRWRHASADQVTYTGPAVRPLPERYRRPVVDPEGEPSRVSRS